MIAWQPITPDKLVLGDVISVRRHYGSCENPPYPATTIQLAGRVVAATKGFVTIEWCTLRGEALHPPKLHHDEYISRRGLERCNLQHMPSQSPTERDNAAGRFMMMHALRKACGRDPKVLAQCVDPEGCVQVGSERAHRLLQGDSAIREWMIRQCDGRLERPEPVEPDFDVNVRELMRALPGVVVKEVRLRPTVEDEDHELTREDALRTV